MLDHSGIYKSGLLTSTAITKAAGAVVLAGALSLPMGFVLPMNYALAQCAPLTAGADPVVCPSVTDGVLFDALGGNDTITVNAGVTTGTGAGAGATVAGGADNDSISLGLGSHIALGVGGTGLISGDAGNDTIILNRADPGRYGAGTVSGGANDDSIALSNLSYIGTQPGGQGHVLGDGGNDTITLDNSHVGHSGDGTVDGGTGNDSIAFSNNTRVGDNPNSSGVVLGNTGLDTITLNASHVGFEAAGTVSGGDAADSIALSGGSQIGSQNTGTGVVLGDAGADTITLNNSRVGNSGAGTVSGGAGGDSIALSAISAVGYNAGSTGVVLGDTGADTITLNRGYVGNSGAGTVDGGAGADSISLSNYSYIGYYAGSTGKVLGDAGADTITLSHSYVGKYGNGTVSGGTENDSISLSNTSFVGYYAGVTGQVLGDAGSDTITIDASSVGDSGAGTVSGGIDNDSIALSNLTFLGLAMGSTGQVLGDAGVDTITISNSRVGQGGAATVSGGAGNDSIALSAGSILGFSAGGTGMVLGDAGADTITLNNSRVGQSGDGTVSGGADNDSIALSNNSFIGFAAGSSGQVLGDAGADTITLNFGAVGNYGSGTVSGGADNDSIALSTFVKLGINAAGTGRVLGDAGADTITLNNSIIGYYGAGTVSGGAGGDSIALSNASSIGYYAGSRGQVLGDAGNDTITISGSTIGVLGMGTVDGGAENDSIALSAGTNIGANGRVLGNAGNDTISVDDSVVRNAAAVIDGGANTDQLTFVANGNATVPPGEFVNFELLRKEGAANLTLNGNQTFATSTTVAAGTLTLGGGTLTTGLLNILNGGTFVPNSTVAGNVQNAGLVSPGGANNQDTLTVQGNFTQTATGQLDIDVFAANGVSDRVVVTGTATLGGTLNLIINGVIAPSNSYTILQATTVAGAFANIQQTAAISQTVTVSNTNAALGPPPVVAPPGVVVVVTQTVNFATNAGTPNQISTGAGLNAVLAAGTSGTLQQAMTALGTIVDIPTFQQGLDQLHSEPYLGSYLSTWVAAGDFARTMMSCPTVGDGSVALGTTIATEGECAWARLEGRFLDQDRTNANIGFDETNVGLSAGAQFGVFEDAGNANWTLGFGARYEHVNTDIDTRADSEGDRGALAIALKGQWGDTTLATVVSGGYGSFDI